MFKSMLDWIFKFLIGDDIFISYSRADGATYAAGLAGKLTNSGYSCKLDLWGTEPTPEMPESLKKALRRSAVLVLIGTEGAAKSVHVQEEIIAFKKTGRMIIPIVFDNVLIANDYTSKNGRLISTSQLPNEKLPQLVKAKWAQEIEGLPISCEGGKALKSGVPADGVVNRIEKTFTYSRKDERLKKTSKAVAALLVILLAASGAAFTIATIKGTEAAQKTAEAQAATQTAEIAKQSAETAKQDALDQQAIAQTAKDEAATAKADAEEQKLLAATEKRKAEEQTKIAAEQTKVANEQTKIAQAKTKLADAAAKEAETQTAKAQAAEQKRLTAENLEEKGRSIISQNYFNVAQTSAYTESLNGVPWIQKAIAEAPRNDGNLNNYKVWAMNLTESVPKLIIRPPGGLRQKTVYSPQGDKAATVSESWKISLWNLKTGEEIVELLKNCDCVIRPVYPEPENEQERGRGISFGGNPIFSPDGKLIAALTQESDGIRLHIWNTDDGGERLNKVDPQFSSNFISTDFQNFRFTPDSQGIMLDVRKKIVGETNEFGNEQILVLDAETGEEKNFITSEPIIYYSENSKDGFRVAKLPISNDPRRNWGLTFRHDEETTERFAVVKDLLTGQIVGQTPLPESLEYINFTGGGGRLVMIERTATNGRQISAFDIESNTVIEPVRFATSIGQEYKILGFSTDDNRLIVDCGNVNIELWELDKKAARIFSPSGYFVKKNLKAFFTKDEEQIVYIGENPDSTEWNPKREVHIFNLKNGNTFTSLNLNGEVSVTPAADLILQELSGSILIKEVKKKSNGSTTTAIANAASAANAASGAQFALKPDECFIKAVRVPQKKALLTVSLTPCSPRSDAPSKVTMQLWDMETRKPMWVEEGIALGETSGMSEMDWDIIFSPSGNNFITTANTDSFIINGNQSYPGVYSTTLRTWKTANGNPIPNLQPMVGAIETASFNGDESELLTVWQDKKYVRHVYRTNIADGTTTTPRQTLGIKIGYDSPILTADGRYIVFPVSGLEFAVRDLEDNSRPVERYFFTNREAALLALKSIRKADKIAVNSDGDLVAEFKNSFALTIKRSGDIELTSAAGGESAISIFPPEKENRFIHHSDDVSISRSGKLILYSNSFSIDLFESQTGVRLINFSIDDKSKDFVYVEIAPDNENLLIVENYGQIRSQKIYSDTKKIPIWLAGMGEALSGMRIKNGIRAVPMPHGEYLEIRKKYRENLIEASRQKDSEAIRILENWNP